MAKVKTASFDIAAATAEARGPVADAIREQAAERAAIQDKGLRPVKNKCIVCGIMFDANMITVNGKDTGKITPPRCPVHQTEYLTNSRVNKVLKDIRLLGNLKTRLTKEQRVQIVGVISDAIVGVQAHYDNVKEQAASFKLAM